MGQDFKGKTVAEIAGDLLLERRKLVGDAAAERRGHPTGAEELARKEEQEAFWKSFTTDEDDARTWAEGLAAGEQPEAVRMKISAAKYKRRWEIFAKKADLPSKLAWAKEMAKLGPPAQPIEPFPTTAATEQAQSAVPAVLPPAPGLDTLLGGGIGSAPGPASSTEAAPPGPLRSPLEY